ncbi:hypothetical protein [Helicobacter suis]|uniref:hypothetical protein n=1 Tax=Helicobacter suis TaxID=104628 RepID=UPI001F0878DA|nr:hypothetical protein [Helicobacter suis]
MGTIKNRIIRKIKRLFMQPLPSVVEKPTLMSDDEIKRDKELYTKLNNDPRFEIRSEYEWIFKEDKYAENGCVTDNTYFIQDIWGARKVFLNKPRVHYDVGSRVVGFIAHLLSMNQRVVLIDIRAMHNDLDTDFINNSKSDLSNRGGGECGISYIQSDATHLNIDK